MLSNQKLADKSGDDAPDEYERGVCFVASEQWVEARDSFEIYLKMHPDSADVRDKLGFCLEKLGLIAEALEQYTQAIDLEPTNWSALHNRGRLHLDHKNFKSAKQDLNAANVLSPNNPLVLASLGEYYLQRAKFEKSIQNYQKALSVATEDEKKEFAEMVKYNLAQTYTAQGNDFYINGDFVNAIVSYSSSLERDQRPSEIALNQIGMSYFHLKQYSCAQEYFNRLIKFYREESIESNNGWMNRAECLYLQGKLNLAKGSLAIAKEISSGDDDILELEKKIAATQILCCYRQFKEKRREIAAEPVQVIAEDADKQPVMRP